MKRHILLLSLLSACFLSCEIESADTPTRENYTLAKYASETTDGRIIFPLAMMETAFNIETYENATPEEKVRMTYIFNTLLKQGNNYKMTNFHSFYLIPDGNSIHTKGASWHFSAFNYGSYATEFTLDCIEEGKWELSAKYDNGQIDFDISQLPQEESLFNWEISITGSLTSGKGRIVEITSVEPLTRKVSSDQWECMTVMTGKLLFNIYENANATAPLDTFTHSFSGRKEYNYYYQL